MGGGGRGDGAGGVWMSRWPEGRDDRRRESDGSRDAVKGQPTKVGFVWPLAYAFPYSVKSDSLSVLNKVGSHHITGLILVRLLNHVHVGFLERVSYRLHVNKNSIYIRKLIAAN